MARRMRSFTSAASKGKGGQVFFNNMSVIAAQNRKKRGKEEAIKEKALARQQKAEEKEREKEHKRQQKAQEKAEREQQKLNEKITKYYKRLELEFEKKGIILIDTVALGIIKKAIDSSVSVSQVKKYFIDGEEDNLKLQTVKDLTRECISHCLKVGSIDDYIDQPEYEPLCYHLKDKNYSSIEKLGEDDEVKNFLFAITEREDHLESRIPHNKEISEFISKLIDDFVMLPEDFSAFNDMIEADRGMTFTVESIKKAQEYSDGVKNKESLVKKVNTQYAELMNTPTGTSE